MTVLPSKFQVGNLLLALALFVFMGLPFMLMDLVGLVAYSWGPIAFLTSYGLHRYRAKQHHVPKSTAEALYNIQTRLDKLNTEVEELTL